MGAVIGIATVLLWLGALILLKRKRPKQVKVKMFKARIVKTYERPIFKIGE